MTFRPHGSSLVFPLVLGLGCAPATQVESQAPNVTKNPLPPLAHAPAGPSGVRLVPALAHALKGWGRERDGSALGLVGGVRVIVRPDGSMEAASELLPSGPTDVVAVPERMGGGYLFAARRRIWQANRWLGPLRPLFVTGEGEVRLSVGLDRVYAWRGGWLGALDPRSWSFVDPGPIPASPALTQIAALDAWRALAIADLRGVVVTFDAGATWLPVSLPVDPVRVAALANSFAVEGSDRSWWGVDSDGPPSRLDSAPPLEAGATMASTGEPPIHPLGEHPLEVTVADGWPLEDGVALVARDGNAYLVDTVDGTLLETRPGVLVPGPSRCRGISLSAPSGDAGAFGFVCGLPHGWTAVYRWDPLHRSMVELRSFSEPRQVLSFGNGALAVRGGCHSPWSERDPRNAGAWCVMRPGGGWHEVTVPHDDGRLVVLSDGRLVVVEPPSGGDISTLRLILVDRPRPQEVRIAVPALPDGVLAALTSGLWLDGFEERRPGVLSGWVNLAASALGVEIALDGTLRVGEYLRDAGAPIVSGRWGLGWTASRAGFETIDGGMTWRRLELPEPLGVGAERACGPLGCVIGGWIRIGWGGPTDAVANGEPPSAMLGGTYTPPNLDLRCDDREGSAPAPRHRQAPTPGIPAVTSTVPGDGRKFPRDLGMARLRIWGGPSTQAHDAWRWVVDWTSPWGGPAEGMSTIPSIAPWNDLTSARRALGAEGARGSRYWVLAPSSTAEHALLIGQSRVDDGNPQIFLLDANSPPVEVLRFDGQPVGAFEDAMRARGRWIFATAQGSNQLSATVVWAIQDGTMRELARVPRSIQGARVPARLATRSDSDTIGLVVEGQVDAVRRQAMLWVMPIGSGSGVVDEPEELSPARLGENAIPLCSASDTGWVVEMRYAGHVRLELDGRWTRLYSPVSRLRISRQGACLEGLLGTPESPTGRLSSGKGAGSKTIAQDPVDRAARRTIDVGALSSVAVRSLRCWQSSP